MRAREWRKLIEEMKVDRLEKADAAMRDGKAYQHRKAEEADVHTEVAEALQKLLDMDDASGEDEEEEENGADEL